MKDKKQILVETLLNKMFEIAGHQVTYDDIKDRKDEWYREYTMTEEQSKEWCDWGEKYIKKTLKFPKTLARREMIMFDLNYGLTIKGVDKNI
jgi:hypothetical protein